MVEAVITELEVPTYFLRVVGFSELGVRSRAACGLANYSTGCVWVLDEDDRASLVAQGDIEFNSSCEVMVNSTHDSAFTVNGNACLNADYIGTSGGYVNNGNANVGCMGGSGSRRGPGSSCVLRRCGQHDGRPALTIFTDGAHGRDRSLRRLCGLHQRQHQQRYHAKSRPILRDH